MEYDLKYWECLMGKPKSIVLQRGHSCFLQNVELQQGLYEQSLASRKRKFKIVKKTIFHHVYWERSKEHCV